MSKSEGGVACRQVMEREGLEKWGTFGIDKVKIVSVVLSAGVSGALLDDSAPISSRDLCLVLAHRVASY